MKLISIQYLRAFAALTVIIFHAKLQIERLNYNMDWFFYPYMHFGIDIFFVMSGFLMWITTRSKPITPWQFFFGRIIRVAPLYWLATTFVVALAIAVPGVLQSSHVSPALTVASYLFIPWYNDAQGGSVLPLFVVGWTLNLEVFYYLVFALTLMLPLRKRLIASMLAFGGITLVSFAPSVRVAAFDLLFSYRAAEFGVGIAIGYAFSEQRWVVSKASAIAMIVVGVLLVPVAEVVIDRATLHNDLLMLGGALLIAGTILMERHYGVRNLPWLVLIGDATYSIYLTHPIVLSAFGQFVKRADLGGTPGFPLVFTIASIAFSISFGLLAYSYVEKPLGAWMVKSLTPRPKAQPAIAEAHPV
jgi:peptidoglycan/LPS O-acetylase OafA/YrhL